MKRKTFLLACTCLLGWLGACTSDTGLKPQIQGEEENGEMTISFTGTAATRSTTTTISPEEARNFLITVSQRVIEEEGEGEVTKIIRGPQALGAMNMRFPVGVNYSVYAESCSEADAETNNNHWGQKRFVGTSEDFEILKGQTTKVKVGMSVENAAMCVVINPSLSNFFRESCTISLSEADRGLVWNYDNAGQINEEGVTTDGQVAYFNLNGQEERIVNYTITAKSENKTIEKTGTITLEKAKMSRLNLAYNSGFFTLTINVNQEELYVNNTLTIGPDDITPDDGQTDANGSNDEFNIDDSEIDYDQYN